MDYKESKQILLKDIRGIKDKKARLFIGQDSYTMPELADEIENETEMGKWQIEMHISAMETIERLRKEKVSKKENLFITIWKKFIK